MKKALKNLIESRTGLKCFGDLVRIDADGELYPLPLVQGNAKIGASVWHASTLPTADIVACEHDNIKYEMRGTCPTTCAGCYGTKGNYNFNDIKYILMRRTALLRLYAEIYFFLALCQIKAENIIYIRVHATGDFIENEAAGWYKIFKAMPYLKGWTYTKCKIAGDIKRLNDLKNFNIVNSNIKGCGFNFGHIDYILKVYNKLVKKGITPYICRCGIDAGQHCSNCTGCSKNKYVLFIEHSTEYKAHKDPLYNTIKELIERQPLQLLDM